VRRRVAAVLRHRGRQQPACHPRHRAAP
jgi:hypothetical protein